MRAPGGEPVRAEGAFRLLSNLELAHEWVRAMRERRPTGTILEEFRRREWQRIEEDHAAGHQLSIPPMYLS